MTPVIRSAIDQAIRDTSKRSIKILVRFLFKPSER